MGGFRCNFVPLQGASQLQTDKMTIQQTCIVHTQHVSNLDATNHKCGLFTGNMVRGHIVDVASKSIFDGAVSYRDGYVTGITRCPVAADAPFIMPGLIDAHIHIESTLLTPENYAALAVAKGVTGVVADPHEIANVIGIEGVDFMIRNGAGVHFNFNWGASPCVPCTSFETPGASLGISEMAELLRWKEICCVGEFMNAFGVISGDAMCLAKIEEGRKAGKPIDGHAPGLDRESLARYAAAGISTDHECVSLREALDHLSVGIDVIIREGSASVDFEALSPLLADYREHLMFCSDDKYPDEMEHGYIDDMVRRSLKKGYPLWNVLNAACLEPVRHYNLNCGLLRVGDKADFILVDNLEDFNVIGTYIDGMKVFGPDGVDPVALRRQRSCGSGIPNRFEAEKIADEDIRLPWKYGEQARVIVASDRSIRTCAATCLPKVENGFAVADTATDMLKIVVLNRYAPAKPQVAFISGFKLKRGAMAATIAHDSHNIVAIGVEDASIVDAVNSIVEMRGGMVFCDGSRTISLPLPVAGLMSPLDGEVVAKKYAALRLMAQSQGCPFNAPFMTMAFMSLPVIPELKITDKGLFDVNKFAFTNLME